MSTSDYMDDVYKWADSYEAAIKNGVFKDDTKSQAKKSNANGESSYFGVVSGDRTPDAISDEDSAEWNSVNDLADETLSGVISESKKKSKKSKKLNEHDNMSVKDVLQGVQRSANPIHQNSVGNDQTNPHSMGYIYTDDQIQQLADLKVKLHDLTDKLATAAGKGLKFEGLSRQIEEAQKKIDDLSDDMTQPTQSVPD